MTSCSVLPLLNSVAIRLGILFNFCIHPLNWIVEKHKLCLFELCSELNDAFWLGNTRNLAANFSNKTICTFA